MGEGKRANDGDGGQDSPCGQGGSALLFVLCAIVVIGLITVGLSAFANANQRATTSFKNVRSDRYAADAAMKEAVNWISENNEVAVDPNYQPDSNDDCVFHSTAATGQAVTVSCQTDAGSEAGVPPDQGILPPEGLLLLGDRHNEPGPYSQVRCKSVRDDIVAFFEGDPQHGAPETAFLGKKRLAAGGWGNFSGCTARNRGSDPIRIEGDVVVGGKLKLADNLKLLVEGGDGAAIQVRYGCDMPAGSIVEKAASWATNKATVAIPNAEVQCNRSASTVRAASAADPMPWDGSTIFTDPGRKSSVTGASSTQPIGDIQPEFLPIGFADDGGLKPGYNLPERTTAYVYDQAAWNALSPKPANVPEGLVPKTSPLNGSSCGIERGTPVIFLWGWYRSSEVLNRYTAEKLCPDQTYWFAPDPGADNKLLTADDKTAPFYMDFTQDTAGVRAKTKCGSMQAEHPARWCLGGADNVLASKPRVVVGWPNEWTAMPTADPTGGGGDTGTGYGSRVGAYLDTAGSIEGNFLSYWSNHQNGAKKIDSNVARYRPCSEQILWWTIRCPSLGNRSLRMAQFTPKVAGGPIAEPTMSEPAKTHGLIHVDVAFAMRNTGSLVPKIAIDRLDPSDDSVESCGTFDLVLSTPSKGYEVATNYNPASPFPANSIGTLSAADQAALARDCGAVDQINNLRINFQVSGNWSNAGIPEFFLDGSKIYYDSYQGASFPLPTDGVIPSTPGAIPAEPAKSDCNDEKPGGQLIFGGESHVYGADGSLEVCAGPNPDDPSGSMAIGIYGVPAVAALRPSAAAWTGTAGGSRDWIDSGKDLSGARRIGDPNGGASNNAPIISEIAYGRSAGGFDDHVAEARARLSFPSLTVPPGYEVASVRARASYNPSNSSACTVKKWIDSSTWDDIINFFFACTSPRLMRGSNSIDMPTNDGLIYVSDLMKAGNAPVNQQTTLPSSFLSMPDLTSGSSFDLTWAARGRCIWVCSYDNDRLDGVELDVTIVPTNSGTAMLRPQSGCITATPNYDRGEGTPDCALVRVDSYGPDDSNDKGLCTGNCTARRTNWFGRVSVKGTIYAPSSAVEIDDNDIGYPLATRGAILRHLRLSGSKERSKFVEPSIGGDLDRTPNDRQTVLTACTQSNARRTANEPCSTAAGDRMLARSGVRFTVETPISVKATVPKVDWYTDERTKQ